MTQEKTLLEILQDLYDNGPSRPDTGICHQKQMMGSYHLGQFLNLIKEWPKHSGQELFPIEGAQAYLSNTLGCWEGNRGELRRELLAWCIEQLSQQPVIQEEST